MQLLTRFDLNHKWKWRTSIIIEGDYNPKSLNLKTPITHVHTKIKWLSFNQSLFPYSSWSFKNILYKKLLQNLFLYSSWLHNNILYKKLVA